MNKPRNILVLADHHQKEVKTLFVLLSMIFIMAYGFYRIILKNNFRFLSSGSVIAVYLLLCALWAGASIFLHFALYRKRLELHIIAACILPVFGLFYFLAFTPNTVPDELYHFASAYKVSNALLFVQQPLDPMSIPMRQSDISFLDTILPNSVNVDLYDFEKSYYIVQRSADLICKDNSIGLFYSQSSIENAPLCFFASGIGITIARMLNLGPVYLYYAGQLMNLMVTIASFCLAIRLTPVFKESFFVMGMLPIVLHEAASYSYDPIVISTAVLFSALLLEAVFSENELTITRIVFMSVLSAVLAPSKIVYFPMVILTFLIPKEKFGARNHMLIKCIIAGAGLLSLEILQVTRIVFFSATTPVVENYSISWILSNPLESIDIFIRTIFVYGEFYMTTLVGSSLAWLQVDIPFPVYAGFLILLFITPLKQKKTDPSFKFSSKLVTAFILMVSAVLVMLSMFVASTWAGSEIILQVQGRYFLPLLPFAFWIIRNDRFTITPETGKNLIFATNYVGFVYAGYCFLHLLYII